MRIKLLQLIRQKTNERLNNRVEIYNLVNILFLTHNLQFLQVTRLWRDRWCAVALNPIFYKGYSSSLFGTLSATRYVESWLQRSAPKFSFSQVRGTPLVQ